MTKKDKKFIFNALLKAREQKAMGKEIPEQIEWKIEELIDEDENGKEFLHEADEWLLEDALDLLKAMR